MATLIKPLTGVKVLELGGLAPVPHCGLVLADFGADVTVVEKKGDLNAVEQRLTRGKRFISADLKAETDIANVRKMCLESDVLLDPYRPGVLEKLGLDPVKLLEQNQKLIVCRLTGYGQNGAMSDEAGHDINYVAITGLLPTLAGHNRRPPWPPANLLADFAGGGLTAAFGVVAALFSRSQNAPVNGPVDASKIEYGGKGCIIDASMAEGLAYLGSFVSMYKDVDMLWNVPYAPFSGDCPIYRNYETQDKKFMSVGALEPKFNVNLFKVLGLKRHVSDVYERPEDIVKELEAVFRTKTRDEWTEIFKGKDACVAPVLELEEAGDFAHNAQRGTYVHEDGRWVPQPAPKLYEPAAFDALLKAKL